MPKKIALKNERPMIRKLPALGTAVISQPLKITTIEAIEQLRYHLGYMEAHEDFDFNPIVNLTGHEDAILHLLIVVLDQQRRIDELESRMGE